MRTESYLQGLAERLARLIHSPEQVERPVFDPASHYADKVRELLVKLSHEGKHLLVILDGVDEALGGNFDASIFPKVLPPSIRIVVSARLQSGDVDAQGWIRRLEWEVGVNYAKPLELAGLSETAIADVLFQLGAPLDVMAKDQAIIRRLSELTEGEPLLLRYYAEDLWRIGGNIPGITLNDLNNLRPGFGSYFQRWLDHQREAWRKAREDVDTWEVEAVLGILAFAHGPIKARDLLDLRQLLLQSPSPLTTETLLRPLRQFVIGDG